MQVIAGKSVARVMTQVIHKWRELINLDLQVSNKALIQDFWPKKLIYAGYSSKMLVEVAMYSFVIAIGFIYLNKEMYCQDDTS